jgi:hypothetical protein
MIGKINEDFIIILKSEEKNGFLVVDFLPIKKLLKNKYKDFIKEINSDTSAITTLRKFVKFKFLLEWFDYSEDISTSYEDIPNLLYFRRLHNFLSKRKEDIIEEFALRVKAYRIEKTYNTANLLIDKGKALAFSHRKIGWTSLPFNLNEKFQVQFNTNFGYGYVSYFYLVVKYKDIIIIPYSDWVVYKNAGIYEIQCYTKKYLVKDESWLETMEDCKNLFNLSKLNEKKFIEKYIIDEAKVMVDGLKSIMKYNEFKLLRLDKDIVTLKMDGYKIIEYRGEKISGALKFISHLTNFNDNQEIMEIIKEIKNINLELLPILQRENELLTERIKEIEPEYTRLKPIVERLSEESNKITRRKNKILDDLEDKYDYKNNTDKISLKDILRERDYQLSKEIPDWEKRSNEYFRIHNQFFNPLRTELEKLKPVKETIHKYMIEIENYFSKN